MSSSSLRFGVPSIVGTDYYATGFEGFADFRHALGKAEGGWYGTADGGATWSSIFAGFPGDLHCTSFPSPTGTNRQRCEAGNAKSDGYHYVYNDGRGTAQAACGETAHCYCCRCLNTSACALPQPDPAAAGNIGAAVASPDGRTLHDLGDVTSVADKDAEYFAFNSSHTTYYSYFLDLPLSFAARRSNDSIVFRGLPQPATCGDASHAFGCPFRTGGRGSVRLPDGSLVMSIIVYWGGAHANPDPKLAPKATSVVAFRSTDGVGLVWEYAGTILDAASAPSSEEGPNENDLALLADGKTILSVIRLDAGDGPVTRPYKPYVQSLSDDGGRTWSAPVSMGPGVGCARPRLLSLGMGGVVLSGGRLSPTNRDVLCARPSAPGPLPSALATPPAAAPPAAAPPATPVAPLLSHHTHPPPCPFARQLTITSLPFPLRRIA